MDNVTVDGFEMRHLSDGFSSNSLYRERKMALELMSPRREAGERDGMKKKRQRDESK